MVVPVLAQGQEGLLPRVDALDRPDVVGAPPRDVDEAVVGVHGQARDPEDVEGDLDGLEGLRVHDGEGRALEVRGVDEAAVPGDGEALRAVPHLDALEDLLRRGVQDHNLVLSGEGDVDPGAVGARDDVPRRPAQIHALALLEGRDVDEAEGAVHVVGQVDGLPVRREGHAPGVLAPSTDVDAGVALGPHGLHGPRGQGDPGDPVAGPEAQVDVLPVGGGEDELREPRDPDVLQELEGLQIHDVEIARLLLVGEVQVSSVVGRGELDGAALEVQLPLEGEGDRLVDGERPAVPPAHVGREDPPTVRRHGEPLGHAPAGRCAPDQEAGPGERDVVPHVLRLRLGRHRGRRGLRPVLRVRGGRKEEEEAQGPRLRRASHHGLVGVRAGWARR